MGERFTEVHRTTYGYAETGEPCEPVNLRLSAVGRIPKPRLDLEEGRPEPAGGSPEPKSVRPVYFEDAGYVDCAIYDRLALAVGTELDGPAVVEEADATTLIHPDWRCAVGEHGVLLLARADQESGTAANRVGRAR